MELTLFHRSSKKESSLLGNNHFGTSGTLNRRTIMTLKSIFIALLLFSVMGCSVYTFNPRGKSTLSSISILLFENTTGQYGLEDKMTELVIDAFIDDGSIKVVPESNAEALVSGKLIKYIRQPYEYDETDIVQSYKITMTFEIKLINTADNSEIWVNTFSQFGVFIIDEEVDEDGEERAIVKLVDDIINKTTKSW